jgi:hypothetical protein
LNSAPFPSYQVAFLAAARSGQGREAAKQTLDGEDRCEIVVARERGLSCSFLAARFAEERGAREGGVL